MIENLKITILLLLVAANAQTSAQENRIPSATEGMHTVHDTQLLSGDSRRTYLDIIEVKIRENLERTAITVTVAGAFPKQEFLFGTGFRFDISIFEQPVSKDLALAPDATFSVHFDSNGWQYNLFKEHSEQTEAHELRFEAGMNTFTINIPSELLREADTLTVEATTSDFPKWKPITTHNPIAIELRQNPANQTH